MLFSGTTSISSFKYFILNEIVKKLKQGSKSVGNIINGTSETLRDEIVVNTENVKNISIHVPTHIKPNNDNEFGHYLAGLIEGDGHFSSKQQLVIVFHTLDVSLAYYIKARLGFGSVKNIKDKNAYILVIAAKKGLEKVLSLINGKIRTENKYHQINDNILNHKKFIDFGKSLKFKLRSKLKKSLIGWIF